MDLLPQILNGTADVGAAYRRECMVLFATLVKDVVNIQLDDAGGGMSGDAVSWRDGRHYMTNAGFCDVKGGATPQLLLGRYEGLDDGYSHRTSPVCAAAAAPRSSTHSHYVERPADLANSATMFFGLTIHRSARRRRSAALRSSRGL